MTEWIPSSVPHDQPSVARMYDEAARVVHRLRDVLQPESPHDLFVDQPERSSSYGGIGRKD